MMFFNTAQCENDKNNTASPLPHKVETRYLHLRSHAKYFFCLWKFLRWLRSIFFHNLRQYLLYQTCIYIQPFGIEVDGREIWYQMDVSTVFYNYRYCVFTLWRRPTKQKWKQPTIVKNNITIGFEIMNSWKMEYHGIIRKSWINLWRERKQRRTNRSIWLFKCD